ncbi:MAG: sugar phosphate isomerase/epimerase [Planctomycetes bacterium]|nr:sugar phosphate isomerase/epimerase [Planctomycetota bacterium]
MAGIALQLYSVREQIGEKGYAPIVRQVAEMGYEGVEPAGFAKTSPEEAGKLFRDLNLKIPSAHMGLPVGEALNESLEAMEAIGATRLITGKGPKDFETVEKIKASCELFNEGAANLAGKGMTLGIHNHYWEMNMVEGKRVYEHMKEYLAPEVFFQVDTYWAMTGGKDPVALVKELGPRAPLLHIKDGPGNPKDPQVAVGQGKMDFPPLLAAATHAEWLIVELDHCATDMLQAVKESCEYLKKIRG